MRFLKTKIRLAQAAEAQTQQETKKTNGRSRKRAASQLTEKIGTRKLREKRNIVKVDPFWELRTMPSKKGKKSDPLPQLSPTKNIIINYGRAISTFAISKLALPYLQSYLDDKSIILSEFIDFVNEEKVKISGIQGLKSLLLVEKDDEPKIALFKKAFKMLSEVFIKYFSVNWIIHGKVSHKMIYLKYRSKMLRRIQNPEFFTYVGRNGRPSSASIVDIVENEA